jgi:hypothetical protein
MAGTRDRVYVIMSRAINSAIHHENGAAEPASNAASIGAEVKSQELRITLPQVIDRLEASLKQGADAKAIYTTRNPM